MRKPYLFVNIIALNFFGLIPICVENTPIKRLYYSISEVSKLVDEEQYVLRYWETEFEQLRPQKNRAGNRVYNENDVEVIRAIQQLLRIKRHTIEGAKEHLRTMQFTFTTDSNETEQKTAEENSAITYSVGNDDHIEAPTLHQTVHNITENTASFDTSSQIPLSNENSTVAERLDEADHEESVISVMDSAPPNRIAESAYYTFSHAAIAQVPQATTIAAPMLSISVPPNSPTTDNTPQFDQSEPETKIQHVDVHRNDSTVVSNTTLSTEPINDLSTRIDDSRPSIAVPLNIDQQTIPLPNVQFTREELLSMRDTLRQLLHLLEKPEHAVSPSLDAHSKDNTPSETAY